MFPFEGDLSYRFYIAFIRKSFIKEMIFTSLKNWEFFILNLAFGKFKKFGEKYALFPR